VARNGASRATRHSLLGHAWLEEGEGGSLRGRQGEGLPDSGDVVAGRVYALREAGPSTLKK